MSEPIDDVLRDVRKKGKYNKENSDIDWTTEEVGDLMLSLADRFEAAAKALEADRDNWRRQALDEDARANATHKDSLEVGDVAAMREAFEEMLAWYVELHDDVAAMGAEMEKARAALAKPPRNCDVGTAKKQSLRFEDFCNLHRSCKKGCSDCPLLNCEPSCEFEWANMPYGKGATHEQK